MALQFACPCGQHLEIDDVYAGRPVAWPSCKGVVTAPPARRRAAARLIAPPPPTAADYEVIDDDPGHDERDDEPARPKRFSTGRRDRDGDGRDRDGIKDPDVRKLMKKARSEARQDREDRKRRRSGGSGGNSNVVGGIVTMVIAVVWLVVGLAAGWLFYYPPILFVLGFITFARGLMGHDDT